MCFSCYGTMIKCEDVVVSIAYYVNEDILLFKHPTRVMLCLASSAFSEEPNRHRPHGV